MRRVYDAAIQHKIIKGTSPLTELAEVLGIDAPQRVKNWDTRGASAEAMLLIQRKTGINATWIETGEGPQMVAGWPAGRQEPSAQGVSIEHPLPTPAIGETLSQMAQLLQQTPNGHARHRIAELLSAWALAPDSSTVLNSIAAELLHDAETDTSQLLVTNDDWRDLRKRAMRLAEKSTSPAKREQAAQLLRLLDQTIREAGGTENPAETRHGNNSPTRIPR